MVGAEGRCAEHGDVCPCPDEPGMWSAGGNHWKFYDEEDAIHWADTKFQIRYGRLNRFSKDWDGLFQLSKMTIGAPVRWEQCPENKRRREAEIEAKRRTEQSAPRGSR